MSDYLRLTSSCLSYSQFFDHLCHPREGRDPGELVQKTEVKMVIHMTRSAAGDLSEAGYQNLFNLEWGTIQWTAEGFPLVPR